MHFQAGTREVMPIDLEYAAVRASRGRTLYDGSGLRVALIEGYLRPCFAIESSRMESVVRGFDSWYSAMEAAGTSPDEPMMNIIASYDGGWRLLLFPRRKHRPSFYFAEGEERILISPAAVDLGGLCTTPLEHDFTKVTSDHLVRMFDEICVEKGALAQIALAVEKGLRGSP
jgi:hypothetical protein